MRHRPKRSVSQRKKTHQGVCTERKRRAGTEAQSRREKTSPSQRQAIGNGFYVKEELRNENALRREWVLLKKAAGDLRFIAKVLTNLVIMKSPVKRVENCSEINNLHDLAYFQR